MTAEVREGCRMTGWIQGMDPQILVWLVFVIVFVVIELITVGLTSIWFGAGALCALLVAALTPAGLWVQILVFFVVSVALLAATRPFARKYINSRTQKTNVEELTGQEVLVTERVSNRQQTGKGKVKGQEWTVRSMEDSTEFEEGERGRITAVNGVKLIITKVNN